jgi:hypothetical protein
MIHRQSGERTWIDEAADRVESDWKRGGNALMELGLTTPLGNMRLIDVVPIHDRFDITNDRLVAPGSPERSVLYQRISRRGTGQMPPSLHRDRPQGRQADRRRDSRMVDRPGEKIASSAGKSRVVRESRGQCGKVIDGCSSRMYSLPFDSRPRFPKTSNSSREGHHVQTS